MREAELFITCGTLLGCVLLVLWRARPRLQVWGLALGILLVAPLVYAWSERARDARRDQTIAAHQPGDRSRMRRSRWASSDTCKGCHPGAHETWRQTYHRRMTQRASDASVLATWEGVVEDQGRSYRLFREGGRFYVDMPRYGTKGEAGERMTRPMVMTTGSHHQQLYWITVPWSESPPPPGAGALYADRCAKCHGGEGWGAEAGALVDADLLLEGIDAVLRAPGHRTLVGRALTEEERVKLSELVLRMQSEDRLMQFPLAWLVKERRWVNEEHTFLHPEPPPEEREPYQEGWSNGCDQCHAVGARFDARALGVPGKAEVAELGIACEACHGAGAGHAAKYLSPLARYAAHLSDDDPDDIVNPADLDPARSAAVCGQCHAETWSRETPAPRRFRPGDRLEDHVRVVQLESRPLPEWLFLASQEDPELIESGFWKDGTNRIAGRDYNGLVISPCHSEGGLTCVSCHQMHGSDPNDQLADGALAGRDACGGCHREIAANVSAHTHHPAESRGSDCYNCHMPRTTYGLLSVMRAHRIDSPSVEQSLRGRPNACNLCHLDKSLGEVGDHLAEWYGHPTLSEEDRDAPAAAVNWMIAGDGVQRAIVAWHAGWEGAQQASGDWWLAPILAQLLDDPYASVRFLAGQSLARLPGMDGLDYDYVGPPEARIEASVEAINRWEAHRSQAEGQHRSLPGAFIREGRLDLPGILELESGRDDRYVTVNE